MSMHDMHMVSKKPHDLIPGSQESLFILRIRKDTKKCRFPDQIKITEQNQC